MACFWSLPEAVRARAGAKLTPAGHLYYARRSLVQLIGSSGGTCVPGRRTTAGGLRRRAAAVEWETVALPGGSSLSAAQLASLGAAAVAGFCLNTGRVLDRGLIRVSDAERPITTSRNWPAPGEHSPLEAGIAAGHVGLQGRSGGRHDLLRICNPAAAVQR
jgi:hypothetical protein